MADPLHYAIDLSQRRQHLVEVTLTVPADLTDGARVVFPTWTPGSYVIRDYVHHLQQLTATDGEGEPVPLSPDGTTAWRLPEGTRGPVRVWLELYANQLSVRANHVDDRHALLVGPATFPYVEGAEERRHVVEVTGDPDRAVHSLLPAGDTPGTFVATDLDHLMDSAFEVGDHPVHDFEVRGVPHRVVWATHGADLGSIPVPADARAIAETTARLFGGELPCERYTFLCVGWDDEAGGLEHRDGATLKVPVTAPHSPATRRRLQQLIAHEYLHLWNGKRLVPSGLERLDYVTPAPTPSLWVVEGWTSYYDLLLPLRAGLWPTDHFLGEVSTRLQSVLEAPAAQVQSVREASWQAWVKYYVPDENSVNSSVSYYAHGAVLALCLDLLVRREDPGSPGLDAALRLLWERFGRTGQGYGEDDVVAACSEAAGRDLADFFERYVARPAVPPIEDLLGAVGLRLGRQARDDPPAPWLGAQLDEHDGRLVLGSVLRGGPAWRAGLTGGDELLAVDGLRVAPGTLPAVLAAHEPGRPVTVTVFRGPRLVTTEVVPAPPRPQPRLERVPGPSPAQREAFRGWTGLTLDAV